MPKPKPRLALALAPKLVLGLGPMLAPIDSVVGPVAIIMLLALLELESASEQPRSLHCMRSDKIPKC